jgi:Ras family protein T1
MALCRFLNSKLCFRLRPATLGWREGSPRRLLRLPKGQSLCRVGSRSGRELSQFRVAVCFGVILRPSRRRECSMTTLLEPRVTLSYLAYLGYPHSSSWSSFATSHPPSPSAPLTSSRNSSSNSYPFSSSAGSTSTSSAAGGSSMNSSSAAQTSPDHPSYQLLPTTSALQITRPRRPSRRKGTPVERNVFLAYVLGAAGSGKTSLLRAFVGKGFDEEAIESSRVAARGPGARGAGHVTAITTKGMTSGRGKDKSVVNCVEEGGGERYLVVSSGRSLLMAVRWL